MCLFPKVVLNFCPRLYVDKINRDSASSNGIAFGECNVQCLLVADDLALLTLIESDCQYALDLFSNACLDSGIKIGMARTEIICLSRHPVQCSFQTNGVKLQQMEKFKYLGVTFLSDGRQDTQVLEKQV